MILWVNEDPVVWIPSRPSFWRFSSYPLKKGKNSLRLELLQGMGKFDISDIEIGLNDKFLILEKNHGDTSEFHCSFDFPNEIPRFPAVNVGKKIDSKTIDACKEVTVNIIKAIVNNDFSSLSNMMENVHENEISFFDSDMAFDWHVSKATELHAIEGLSLILIFPKKELKDPKIDRFLVSASKNGAKFYINHFLFHVDENGVLRMNSKNKWIKCKR